MTRQHRQFLVENFEALLGGLVRQDVVDADLQVIETRVVQAFDPLPAQQVSVRDEPRERPVPPDAADDGVELWMEQRLAKWSIRSSIVSRGTGDEWLSNSLQ